MRREAEEGAAAWAFVALASAQAKRQHAAIARPIAA